LSTRHLAFGVALAVTGVFFVDWCAVVFHCGCRSLWSGIATYCNIHTVTGPHCPWCEHPLLGGGTAFAAAVVAQWAAVYQTSITRVWKRCALALIAFPLASGLVSVLQRFLWDYWLR
jgi:hypothetical protein